MSRRVLLVAPLVLLAAPASAAAAAPHLPLVNADILGTLGGVFTGIGHAVLGAFSWTIGLASKFILTTVGALVKMLIPHAWVNQGLQIMEWIVAVPDYAAKIATPGGGHEYGFSGVNALRDLFMWLGIAIAPLSLTYATSRAMIGESEPVAIPVLRIAGVAVVIGSYPYWWSQVAALADQITHTILTLPDVSRGLYKLMQYAVAGVALGGWQLIDLALMGAIGVELLALIFLKVAVILLGALLYATGPLMIGLVPTRAGGALARAWLSAVATLFGLGIAWATVFAVGALLIGDAGTAGPLIAGNSAFGSLLGGLLLAIAGLASLWLCLKAAREAAGLLRMQLAGLLALGHHSAASSASPSMAARTSGQSLRNYGSRLARTASAVGGELAGSVTGGAALAGAGGAAGYVGRRGLLGTAAGGLRAGSTRAADPTGALLGRSRAGAVAVRMARAGTASWTASRVAEAGGQGVRSQSSAGRAGAAGARQTAGPAPSAGSTAKTTPRVIAPLRTGPDKPGGGVATPGGSRPTATANSHSQPRPGSDATPTSARSRSASSAASPSSRPSTPSSGAPAGAPPPRPSPTTSRSSSSAAPRSPAPSARATSRPRPSPSSSLPRASQPMAPPPRSKPKPRWRSRGAKR